MKKYIPALAKRIPEILIVVVVFVVFCGVFGRKIYQYSEEGSRLMTQLFEMKSLVSSKELWDDRAKWISQRIPRFNTQTGAANHLLHSMGHSLSDHGLTLTSHEIKTNAGGDYLSPEKAEVFDKATVGITIKGNERDIVEWIHGMQSAGNFTGVDHLSLELGDYGLECRLQVTQWYLGVNRSFNLSEHHEPKVHDLDAGLVDGLQLKDSGSRR